MEQEKKPVYHAFMLKRILIGFSALLLVLLGAILILPGLVPTDSYRDRLEADLSRAFARDVTITGDINISTFPILKVETGSISLANPDGFADRKFVDIQSMTAKIRLWPLLRKRIEISAVTLESPTIRLEKRADGHVNWSGQNQDVSVETGPYKRDGRYTEYDPALALLRIKNGELIYVDGISDRTFETSSINLDLRAPALDQKVRIDGDLIIDGLNTSVDTALSSPEDFLSGLKTDFSASISSAAGEIEVKGQFLASEDIALIADFEARSSEPNNLAKRVPMPEDFALPPLSSVSGNGQIKLAPDSIEFPSFSANAKGDDIDASFTGKLDLADKSESAGTFSLNLSDMNILSPYLNEPIEAINAISSVNATGNVEWKGTEFNLSNVEAAITGSELVANFTGGATYKSSLSVNGNFDGSTNNLPNLIQSAGLSQPDAAALKRVTANGSVTVSEGKIELSNFVSEASDGLINGTYSGEISYGEDLNLDGQFTSEINDLRTLDQALPRDLPYSEIVKRITLASTIQAASGGYKFSNLSAELSNGLLNGDFEGELTLGELSDISGNLVMSADSLRAIATSQNIELPPSTDIGSILEEFLLSGEVTGSPELLVFKSGTIKLDEISGLGDFVINLSSEKPILNGTLSLSSLDLRPYMAAWSAQNPEGKILPWSEEPIILTGLESMDAEIAIRTPSIILDRLELGETKGDIILKNGILTADTQSVQLYDGNASGIFSIQSTNGVPEIAINATMKSLRAQNFFMASAGFDKITGTSDLTLSLTGQGHSQSEIMKSLTGNGEFEILEGQILGLDAGALLSGVDTALAQRQLPEGLGIGKTTNFKDVEGVFSLNNGRANLRGFKLQSGTFFIDANGVIDIGNQSIDFGLHPKLTAGSDLAQFGIPLRFTGGFGQAKAGLDTNLLGDIAKARARQTAGETIRDNLGGPLGNVLGDVISGQSQTPQTPQEEDTTESSTPNTDSVPEEENAESNDEEAEESGSPEEQIENALKDLFGRKKKD